MAVRVGFWANHELLGNSTRVSTNLVDNQPKAPRVKRIITTPGSEAQSKRASRQLEALVWAVDRADYFVLLHRPVSNSVANRLSWLSGLADPSRAFACLAALALKMPEQQFAFSCAGLTSLWSSYDILLQPEDDDKIYREVENSITNFWPLLQQGYRRVESNPEGFIKEAKLGMLHLWSTAQPWQLQLRRYASEAQKLINQTVPDITR